MDQKRFEEAKRKIIGVDRQRLGIGTLSEKTVHAIFKDYYEPDEDHQEIPIENYVADIYKLQAFLPMYPVTIVYPIPYEKWLIWIDEDSGELSKKRKSPKKGSTYQAFKELYKIKMFLKDPNIRFKFVLVNMEEYRLLNGWSRDKKKGSTRYDRIPTDLIEEVEIRQPEDYLQFVPYELEEPFHSKDFAKAAHIPLSLAQTVLNILFEMGTIERVGKQGNSYLYCVVD